MIDDGRPIFVRIADQIESAVLDGSLAEESQAPSTNELAALHRINPATAGRGVSALVADGILYKRRGIGMFVATGARARVLAKRRARFAGAYLDPLLAEAARIGLDRAEVLALLEDGELDDGEPGR